MKRILTSLTMFFALCLSTPLPVMSMELSQEEVSILASNVMFGSPQENRVALAALIERGEFDVVATLVLAMRYRSDEQFIGDALSALVGENITSWNEAMLWQEAHPEVVPHDGYASLKINMFSRIDANFVRFLGNGRADRDQMRIRLEEIVWGGVKVDGIPSLDNPQMIAAAEASYLRDDDLVFGVEINGDVRAYPLRIMGWHEMFNDTIGGVPVALAYCTLCGSGILFETQVEGRDAPLVFGSSGFLYRSNKLMFDRQTDSLWNQFTGEPVAGPLVDADIKLNILPVVITSWGSWLASNPETKVLSLDTGHRRDYGSGVVYNTYFDSPDLMFPTNVRDESVLVRKDYVFGIREFGASKAWPLSAFEQNSVINDGIGAQNLVLIGDSATRSVRAYERGAAQFEPTENPNELRSEGIVWRVNEQALIGPDDVKLPRVAGHIAYWFAWDNYLGLNSALYGE